MSDAPRSPKPARPIWIRWAVSLIALGIFSYLFWPLLSEVRDAARLFATAQWSWLPIALTVQLISYSSLTWLNLLALKPFPGHIGFAHLGATLTSMAFIEVAIPSAGISGVVLRARLLGRHGYAPESSTFTLVIETVFLGIAMTAVAAFGIPFLLERGVLGPAVFARWAWIAAMLLSLLFASWWLLWSEPRSQSALQACVRIWNRIFGRWRLVSLNPLLTRMRAFRQNLATYRHVPLPGFFAAAFGRVFLDVATLGVCFLLFGGGVGWGTVLTGYGLILLLSGMAALPGGFGLADLSIPVVFSRLGAPGPVALAGGLTYRLIAFWLVRLVGFVAWQAEESHR
jgi:uncharacterized protein (TIRG00374 family)